MPHFDHVAVLVRDLEEALGRLPSIDAPIGDIQSFPNEGTREVYIGPEDAVGRLLLVEPAGSEGPYARALDSRGPGLHHVAFDHPDVDAFVAETVRRSDWLLHPATLRTWDAASTVWLKHPAVDVVVELHEAKTPDQPVGAVVDSVRLRGLASDDLLVDLEPAIEPDSANAIRFGERWLDDSFFAGSETVRDTGNRTGGEPHRGKIEAELDALESDILFAVVSGAHLYGFPSADSDVDVRGAYLAPIEEILALGDRPETLDRITVREGTEVDIAFHEIEKFLELLLGGNAVVLEQVFSPLVVRAGESHRQLKEIAADCITRHHAHHYLGFARSRWEAFRASGELKPLLYAYRAVLSGLHLMETGRVDANLDRLAEHHGIPALLDLTERKRRGTEQMTAPDTELADPDAFETWTERLEEAHVDSHLPDAISHDTRRRASDLLVQLRMQ